jgi:hypothetical protein
VQFKVSFFLKEGGHTWCYLDPELYFNFPDIREPVASPGSAYCEYTTFQKYFATDIHPTLNSNLLFPHQSLKKNRMECSVSALLGKSLF